MLELVVAGGDHGCSSCRTASARGLRSALAAFSGRAPLGALVNFAVTGRTRTIWNHRYDVPCLVASLAVAGPSGPDFAAAVTDRRTFPGGAWTAAGDSSRRGAAWLESFVAVVDYGQIHRC